MPPDKWQVTDVFFLFSSIIFKKIMELRLLETKNFSYSVLENLLSLKMFYRFMIIS